MKILFLTVITFTFVSSFKPHSKEIFCESVHCPRNNHIYCNGWKPFHSGFLGTDPHRIILTPFQKQIILDTHNELRNILASGKPRLTNLAGETFPKASNMHKLVWNDELEWAARLNGETCAARHDCASTQTFTFAGQNLAMKGASYHINATEYLKTSIHHWFSEYLNTPIEVIDAYSTKIIKHSSEFTDKESRKVETIVKPTSLIDKNGHFTALVKDITSKIGCVLYSCGKVNDRIIHSMYFVCNYEMTNMIGQSAYEYKEAGYECDRSKKFCSLCLDGSDNEEDGDDFTCFESDLKVPSFGYNNYKSSSAVLFSKLFIYVWFLVFMLRV